MREIDGEARAAGDALAVRRPPRRSGGPETVEPFMPAADIEADAQCVDPHARSCSPNARRFSMAVGSGRLEMRVSRPLVSPAKLAMPAAPLLITKRLPRAFSAGAQVVAARRSRRTAPRSNAACNWRLERASCSRSCAKAQPASDQASPCTMRRAAGRLLRQRVHQQRGEVFAPWPHRPPRRAAGENEVAAFDVVVGHRFDKRSRSLHVRRSEAISVRRCRAARCAPAPAAAPRRTARGSHRTSENQPLNTRRGGCASSARHVVDRVERTRVAVQPADHVQRPGLKIRRTAKTCGE